MLYAFPENNIAFYHLHKTAGGTISRIISHALNEKRKIISTDKRFHQTMQWCSKRYDISNVKLATSLRNPYDQVISLYNWLRRGIKKSGHKAFQKKYRPEQLEVHTMSFGDFTSWYCDNWKSYFEWLQVNGKVSDFFLSKRKTFRKALPNS